MVNISDFFSRTIEVKLGVVGIVAITFIILLTILFTKKDSLLVTVLKNIFKYGRNKIKKSPISSIVFIVVCSLTIILMATSILGLKLQNDFLTTILNFFVSFILAIYLSNYTAEATFKEKQKEAAVRSYRHSVNIKNKVSYCICVAEELIDSTLAEGSENTSMINYIHRIKDNLISIKSDAHNNLNDWGDILTEELLVLQKVEDLEIQKILQEEKLWELDEGDSSKKDLELKIEDIDKEIDVIKNELSDVGKAMWLADRETYNEMFDVHINREKRQRQTARVREVQTEPFSNFAEIFRENLEN